MLFSISVSFTNKNVNHIVIFELKKLKNKNTIEWPDELGVKLNGPVSSWNLDSGNNYPTYQRTSSWTWKFGRNTTKIGFLTFNQCLQQQVAASTSTNFRCHSHTVTVVGVCVCKISVELYFFFYKCGIPVISAYVEN
jgi:hypothetical protein